MSLAYVRTYYQVPARRGGVILYTGGDTPRRGVILSATHLLKVRWEDNGRRARLHPTWEVTYIHDATKAVQEGA